jgi:chromate transporter
MLGRMSLEEPVGRQSVPLGVVAREWTRIGVTGFGGPPTHIRLLRDLCVTRHGWVRDEEFEDAIAACNLLPGPASTQLAIFCAWRVAGPLGAVVGGLGFILPGLVIILTLAAFFLSEHAPTWLSGAAAGAGGAVAAVALHAGWQLAPASWRRRAGTARWSLYVLAGALAAALVGPWVVLVLLGCGVVELLTRSVPPLDRARTHGIAATAFATSGLSVGLLASVAWVAFKVGALSYGGGFVIIPLMQGDAVGRYHWMTGGEFLTAVALGQVTPGPVVQTVSVVGYAAAGLVGGLLAAVVAFTPSFVFVLAGARRFDQLRANRHARAFLDGSGPAAIGAILGSAVPLAHALNHPWQYVVLAGAAASLFLLRRGTVPTLLAAAATGIVVALLGGPVT